MKLKKAKTVTICGIRHTVEYVKDQFDVDTHFGQINYKEAQILINEDAAESIQSETLWHEIVHGILMHIGRSELNDDEALVNLIALALNELKIGVENDIPSLKD